MPDIDIDKIKPGDTVRVRLHTHSMEKAGVDPIEFTTKAYAGYDGVAPCVADSFLYLNPSALTILEHIPARPDWADALVVRDKDGDLWMKGGHRRPDEQLWTCQNDHNTILATADLNDWEPITVVIDADGNAPQPEPEWLDADALDELPDSSIILPKVGLPRVRHFGDWFNIPGTGGIGVRSEHLDLARLLWTPEAGR